MTAKRWQGPSDAVKLRVLKRDRFTCVYCGVTGTDAELEVDHMVPVSKGGSHHIGNLATACRACNQKKSDGTLERSPSAPTRETAGLVGMFLHTYNEQGLRYQGQIIGIDGDRVLVQLFSWIMGEPTNVESMTREFIYSDSCRLYASRDRWIDAAQTANDQKWREQRAGAA